MQHMKEATGKTSTVKDEPSTSDNDKEELSSDGRYYYDDAHGYEEFDPKAADEDDDK
jgi:hypothetical protein